VKKSKPEYDDPAVHAEAEMLAQLEIVRALKPLSPDRRQRVVLCMAALMEADALVPGILEAVSQNLKTVKP